MLYAKVIHSYTGPASDFEKDFDLWFRIATQQHALIQRIIRVLARVRYSG